MTPAREAHARALAACKEARENVLASARGTRQMLAWIDAYRAASVALEYAGLKVLADDPRAEIEWEVPMLPADSPEQAGARIADDEFCQSCGKRGVVGTCMTCEEAGR